MRYKVRALPLYAIIIDPSKTLSYTKVSRRKKDGGVPLLSLPLPHPSHPSLTPPFFTLFTLIRLSLPKKVLDFSKPC